MEQLGSTNNTDRIVQVLPAIMRRAQFGYARATGEVTLDSRSVQGATPTTPGTPAINRATLGAAMKIIGAVKHTVLPSGTGVRYRFPNCRTPEQALALVDANIIRHFHQSQGQN